LGEKQSELKYVTEGEEGVGGVPRQGRLFLPVNADWEQCETFRRGEDNVM